MTYIKYIYFSWGLGLTQLFSELCGSRHQAHPNFLSSVWSCTDVQHAPVRSPSHTTYTVTDIRDAHHVGVCFRQTMCRFDNMMGARCSFKYEPSNVVDPKQPGFPFCSHCSHLLHPADRKRCNINLLNFLCSSTPIIVLAVPHIPTFPPKISSYLHLFALSFKLTSPFALSHPLLLNLKVNYSFRTFTISPVILAMVCSIIWHLEACRCIYRSHGQLLHPD